MHFYVVMMFVITICFTFNLVTKLSLKVIIYYQKEEAIQNLRGIIKNLKNFLKSIIPVISCISRNTSALIFPGIIMVLSRFWEGSGVGREFSGQPGNPTDYGFW